MSAGSGSIRVSAPGRVCLFGEHQDYLGLPVISCAISLRITVEGTTTANRVATLDLPDVGSRDEFPLAPPLRYRVERDYLRSVVNVLGRAGFTFSNGFSGSVHGTIPINSGTSSSSALIVAWTRLLARVSDQHRDLGPEENARLAHEAEVLEFGEPGGMMDHYATSVGGVLYQRFRPGVAVERLASDLGAFVLGDSREPKDTKGILARVKQRVLNVVGRLGQRPGGFSLDSAMPEDVERVSVHLVPEERTLLEGSVRNRLLTERAKSVLQAPSVDHRGLGSLLSEHQTVLRDVLGISTPKIDRMLEAAMAAGAYGGKINGSGGGGCMFAYAPEHTERVAEAIHRAGGTPYIVEADEGCRLEERMDR